jgi:small subunit ribosomal protein S20
MPILKSAKKKLRKDKKRTLRNLLLIKAYKDILKKIKKGKGDLKKLVQEFYSKVDKAAKKKVIHKNKAGRLKSNVHRLIKKIKEKS